MIAAEAKRLQRKLCIELMEYFEPRGFRLDKKEWDIVNDHIVIPFFIMTKQGPFMTMRPSIVYKELELMKSINSILEEKIFNNGVFLTGDRLSSFLKVESNSILHNDKVTSIVGINSWRIADHLDVNWAVEWFISFMEKMGWGLIEYLKNENSVFNFYADVFENFAKAKQNGLAQEALKLDFGAHATMIYLGLKNNEDRINHIIELTNIIHPETMFSNRTKELQLHFSNS